MVEANPHVRSHESTLCALVKPNRLLGSSAAAGWTSLHLDHHEGAGQGDVFDTHPTRDVTLVIASGGQHEVRAFAKGRWQTALYQPGSAGVTPPGESARLRWRTPSQRRVFRTLNIYLPGSLLDDLMDEYRRAGQAASADRLSALSFRDTAIGAHAAALLVACREGEPDIYAAGAARWLLTHLLSQHANWRHLAEDPRIGGTITDRRLSRVVEYMSANLDRSLTLDELSREAGISVHHFGRRFRESRGMGPARYLTMLRIAQARLLLRTTDLAVAEVAARSGYPRASAFATAFLRDVGVSPSEYRAAQ